MKVNYFYSGHMVYNDIPRYFFSGVYEFDNDNLTLQGAHDEIIKLQSEDIIGDAVLTAFNRMD